MSQSVEPLIPLRGDGIVRLRGENNTISGVMIAIGGVSGEIPVGKTKAGSGRETTHGTTHGMTTIATTTRATTTSVMKTEIGIPGQIPGKGRRKMATGVARAAGTADGKETIDPAVHDVPRRMVELNESEAAIIPIAVEIRRACGMAGAIFLARTRAIRARALLQSGANKVEETGPQKS